MLGRVRDSVIPLCVARYRGATLNFDRKGKVAASSVGQPRLIRFEKAAKLIPFSRATNNATRPSLIMRAVTWDLFCIVLVPSALPMQKRHEVNFVPSAKLLRAALILMLSRT